MNKAILPFLTIPDSLVERSRWRVRLSTGDEHVDPDFIANWDNGTDLTFSRHFRLDLRKITESLELSPQKVDLVLAVWAGTGEGTLPTEKWSVARKPLIEGEADEEIEFFVPGEELADAVHLDIAILLSSVDDENISPLAPRNKGDIVWRERTHIRIEGDVSRFPISETDFETMLGNKGRDALWHLQVDWSDLSAEFDTAVRLHVNANNKPFAQQFREGEPFVLQSVMADVMIQVTTGFLNHVENPEIWLDNGPATSLSGVATQWLSEAFDSVDAAQRLLEMDPGRFHARLNAAAAMDKQTS